MTEPPQRATPAGAVTVLLTYAAAALLGGVGWFIGLLIPCEGFLCSIGFAVVGAVVGVLVSAVVAVAVARRDGVRWWYTPITYGLVVGAGLAAMSVPDAVGRPLWVLAAAAPLVGIALSAPLRAWVRALVLALVAGAMVVFPTAQQSAREARWDDQRRTAAATWRAEGVPLFAPVGRDGIVVNSLGVKALYEGGGHEAWYDLAEPGVAGEARVWLETGPNAESQCGERPDPDDLGDGITVLGRPEAAATVCRVIGEAKLSLWQDGSEGDWRGQRLIDLARDLEATDAAWLEQHLRER